MFLKFVLVFLKHEDKFFKFEGMFLKHGDVFLKFEVEKFSRSGIMRVSCFRFDL